jgi:predicted lipoprotein with Yx(FWY)xxD motif
MTKRLTAVAGLAAVTLVVAACGGSSNDSASTGGAYGAAKPAASKSANTAAAVRLGSTKLGKILVDGKGQTLYWFEADKGTSSTCDGACATSWPPLTTSGKPTAGTGVMASKLGTTKRQDGTTEVTYNGHPLYTYAGDQSPGQTTGQELDQFGAEWYVLSRTGKSVE